jgi:hypothetical protein
VLDTDTDRSPASVNGQIYRLVGFDTPEQFTSECDYDESLLSRPDADGSDRSGWQARLDQDALCVPAGAEGTQSCNLGQTATAGRNCWTGPRGRAPALKRTAKRIGPMMAGKLLG